MQTQTLSLSQKQQLQMVLAPQLRQSLEMLQVPILELRAMVQQELETNPTLEEVAVEPSTVETGPDATSVAEERGEGERVEMSEAVKSDLDFDKEFEALAKLDDEWREYFFQDHESNPYSADRAEKRQFFLDSIPQRESLQEHLLDQLRLSGFSDADLQLGELIIGSLNDDGYLAADVAELAASAGCDLEHLENVLSVIHDFHPTGIAARDLRECLLIQLARIGKSDTLAAEIVRKHLDLLGGHKLQDIARLTKAEVEDVQAAANVIATLDPKPGRAYGEDVSAYISPEVNVLRVDGKYVVVLDDEQLPHLRISSHYRSLLSGHGTGQDVKSYIRERIRSGAFVIKSIHQRQRTIQKIATEIVTHQTDFLDNGVSHLRPLTMSEVAKAVGVHETTVSRAVSGKYMRTPVGVFEMKYFFTPGIKTSAGGQISNKSVKDMIGTMVANEDPTTPLSDQDIVETLQKQGVDIARRTVAKYRLMLRIPPSHMRRRF